MTILLYLVPVALCLGLLGLAAFLWALRSGQFDDLDGAAERILFDDDEQLSRNPQPTFGSSRLVLHWKGQGNQYRRADGSLSALRAAAPCAPLARGFPYSSFKLSPSGSRSA